MSFFVTKKYYTNISSTDPMITIFGGQHEFDTYDEALDFKDQFNVSPKRGDEICTGPFVNPYYEYRGTI